MLKVKVKFEVFEEFIILIKSIFLKTNDIYVFTLVKEIYLFNII